MHRGGAAILHVAAMLLRPGGVGGTITAARRRQWTHSSGEGLAPGTNLHGITSRWRKARASSGAPDHPKRYTPTTWARAAMHSRRLGTNMQLNPSNRPPDRQITAGPASAHPAWDGLARSRKSNMLKSDDNTAVVVTLVRRKAPARVYL